MFLPKSTRLSPEDYLKKQSEGIESDPIPPVVHHPEQMLLESVYLQQNKKGRNPRVKGVTLKL
jgi:hypothetical protein